MDCVHRQLEELGKRLILQERREFARARQLLVPVAQVMAELIAEDDLSLIKHCANSVAPSGSAIAQKRTGGGFAARLYVAIEQKWRHFASGSNSRNKIEKILYTFANVRSAL